MIIYLRYLANIQNLIYFTRYYSNNTLKGHINLK